MTRITRKFQITPPERLRLFDETTRRQKARQRTARERSLGEDRGWARQDLYTRGRPR